MSDTGWLSFTTKEQANVGPFASGTGWTFFLTGASRYGYWTFPTSYAYTRGLVLADIDNIASLIPEESIITGIEVKATLYGNAYNSSWEPRDSDVYLSLDRGTLLGANRSFGTVYPYGGLSVQNIYGGPLDLWNTGGLTRAQIISADFSVIYRGYGRSYTISNLTRLGFNAGVFFIKIYYNADRVISDVGAGSESLVKDVQAVVSDVGSGFTYVMKDGVILVRDAGSALEVAIGGANNLTDRSFAFDRLNIKKSLAVYDGSVAFDIIYFYILSILDDIATATDEPVVTAYVTISEVGYANDYSDIDYGFSSVVMRASGSKPSINFTGYKEEVQ